LTSSSTSRLISSCQFISFSSSIVLRNSTGTLILYTVFVDIILYLRSSLLAYLSQTLRGISEDRFSEGSSTSRLRKVQEPERAWQGTGRTAFAEASFA